MNIRVKKYYEKGGKLTDEQRLFLSNYISEPQLDFFFRKEDDDGKIANLIRIIETMPQTYETEKLETENKIVYLHYMLGDTHLLIVEKDKGDTPENEEKAGLVSGKQYQAYGYVILNGDLQMSEWGFINIEDAITNNVQLDIDWIPVPFSKAYDIVERMINADEQPETQEQEALNAVPTNEDEDNSVELPAEVEQITSGLKPEIVKLLVYLNTEKNEVKKAEMWNNGQTDAEDFYIIAYRSFIVGNLRTKTLWQIAIAQGLPVSDHGQEKLIKFNGDDLAKAIFKETGIDYRPELEKAKNIKPVTEDASIQLSKDHETNTINIRKLIDQKGEDRNKYSDQELEYIRTYEGLGGLAAKGYTEREILDQYFTPHIVIEKMWGLAMKYGFNGNIPRSILEPACGIGRMLEYLPYPEKHFVDMYEIDKYSAIIAKLSFPMFNVHHKSFETIFFQGKRHLGMINVSKKYDLVISNPPYREFDSEYSDLAGTNGETEKSVTKAKTFDQYFTMRSVDLLKPSGLLVTILPNSFMNNRNTYNEFKEFLYQKAELIDAYRLPNNIFFNTPIGTDILVIRKK